MNRRAFFRTATLSTAAVLQGSARRSRPAEPAAVFTDPYTIDLADPGAAAQMSNRDMEIFVRLEESEPADPGELSGARLHICEYGQWTVLGVTIGDTLQPQGYRTGHQLGWVRAEALAEIAPTTPRTAVEDFSVPVTDSQDETRYRAWLMFSAGENPELRLNLYGHCLGVLRGEVLNSLFMCLRRRLALGGTA